MNKKFLNKYLIKYIIFAILDCIIVFGSHHLAVFYKFGTINIYKYNANNIGVEMICISIIGFGVFRLFGIYNSIWKYAGIDEVSKIFISTFFCTGLVYLFVSIFHRRLLPVEVGVLNWIFMFFLIGASRMSYIFLARLRDKILDCRRKKIKIMIVGAGYTGTMLAKLMKNDNKSIRNPVVFIDDDYSKQHKRILGIPIIGGKNKIIDATKKYNIDEIVIAIPSATKEQVKQIIDICKLTKCKLKTVPSFDEIIIDNSKIDKIRDINFEDLLGRPQITLDTKSISEYLENKVVLITGGGGSIGSELCRQVAKFNPKQLIVFDIYENNAYELQNELKSMYGETLSLKVLIGSVRDKLRLEDVFSTYKPEVVFHAAAHKHVPLMEDSPIEAIKNNVFGTLYTAECAHKYKANHFILISTDKAVNPTNVMGATKRIAEMIIQCMSKISETKFVAVRFGNVLGSNGSVIPLFKKQISNGGPLTVTHPDVTRYFMTIFEAAQLVIQTGVMANHGEIFILDMGKPVKIIDLAKDVIRLSGFEPDVDIKIEYTGLRPGEKLYEELLMSEEGIQATKYDKIFVGKPIEMNYEEFVEELKNLGEIISEEDSDQVIDKVSKIVTTYKKVG